MINETYPLALMLYYLELDFMTPPIFLPRVTIVVWDHIHQIPHSSCCTIFLSIHNWAFSEEPVFLSVCVRKGVFNFIFLLTPGFPVFLQLIHSNSSKSKNRISYSNIDRLFILPQNIPIFSYLYVLDPVNNTAAWHSLSRFPVSCHLYLIHSLIFSLNATFFSSKISKSLL